MKRILCVWFPDWSIQRLVVARPELRGQPLVLYARDARRGQSVVACSAAAEEAGVVREMPLTEATALLRRSGRRPSALRIEAHCPDADQQQLQELARWCERFSPLVGLEACEKPRRSRSGKTGAGQASPSLVSARRERPECLLLDVTGVGPMFGGESALAEQLCGALRELGYRTCLAIGDSIGAAWAVAHNLSPDAWVVVPPGQSAEAVKRLPITALRLSAEVVGCLRALGVELVEQLLRLPRAGLRERFGAGLLRRIDQALEGPADHGPTSRELIVPPQPVLEFTAERQWEYPVERLEDVEHALADLLQQLTASLQEAGRGVVRLVCQLDCAGPTALGPTPWGRTPLGATPLAMRVDLFRPTARAEHLFDLFRMQLEQRSLPGPVSRLRLVAELTTKLVQEQPELFAAALPGSGRKSKELARLIDRLGSRLGREGVVRACLQADPQPERAFRYLPLCAAATCDSSPAGHARRADSRTGVADSPAGTVTSGFGLRPLFLFADPEPVQVLNAIPQGPPVRWRWRGRELRVLEYLGPERIETGWWRGRSVCRDYYRVQSDRGTRYWLFLDRHQGDWFLQGAFE